MRSSVTTPVYETIATFTHVRICLASHVMNKQYIVAGKETSETRYKGKADNAGLPRRNPK